VRVQSYLSCLSANPRCCQPSVGQVAREGRRLALPYTPVTSIGYVVEKSDFSIHVLCLDAVQNYSRPFLWHCSLQPQCCCYHTLHIVFRRSFGRLLLSFVAKYIVSFTLSSVLEKTRLVALLLWAYPCTRQRRLPYVSPRVSTPPPVMRSPVPFLTASLISAASRSPIEL